MLPEILISICILVIVITFVNIYRLRCFSRLMDDIIEDVFIENNKRIDDAKESGYSKIEFLPYPDVVRSYRNLKYLEFYNFKFKDMIVFK